MIVGLEKLFEEIESELVGVVGKFVIVRDGVRLGWGLAGGRFVFVADEPDAAEQPHADCYHTKCPQLHLLHLQIGRYSICNNLYDIKDEIIFLSSFGKIKINSDFS